MSTSSRSTGCRLLSARESTVAPTFAPQPPQRIATAEIACNDSSALSFTLLPVRCRAGRATRIHRREVLKLAS